jgi:hypothetical protein
MIMSDTTEGFASTDFDMDSLEDLMKKFQSATSSSRLYIGGELIGNIRSMPEVSYIPTTGKDFEFRASMVTSMPLSLFGVPYYLMPSIPSLVPKKPVIHREPIPYGSSAGVWVTAAAIVTVVAFMAIAG